MMASSPASVPAGSVLLLLLLCALCASLDSGYRSNADIERYLKEVNGKFPNITHVYNIGRSSQGVTLWVIAIGKHPQKHTIGIPEFRYVGNIHGNEVVSRELLLFLLDALVEGYGHEEEVTRLVDTVRIHLLPSLNPDGFASSMNGDCDSIIGRYNSNGKDLNRDFPDPLSLPSSAPRQPETVAAMQWALSEPFVLSGGLHGGAVVASYPYDNLRAGSPNSYSASPDNDVFVRVATVYASKHGSMYLGNQCGLNFPGGITNGANWYPLSGGMQDYSYVWGQCLEVTLEVSCCKFPPASSLPELWQENRAALIAYIKQAHLGVKGRVLDSNGNGVANAQVHVVGRANILPFNTTADGEYYRLLLPGQYTLQVIANGFQPFSVSLLLEDGTESYAATTRDLMLTQSNAVPAVIAKDGKAAAAAAGPCHPLFPIAAATTAALAPVLLARWHA
ncbi:unnamed protein product [Lampetra fluviatilis]